MAQGLSAPRVIHGAMNRAAFDIYVETRLALTLAPGDVVILDNLSVHKSARAEAAIRARGAWMLFLPQYFPDLNPVEMAFSKIKAHLCNAAARFFDARFAALHDICTTAEPNKCKNCFKVQRYPPEFRHKALAFTIDIPVSLVFAGECHDLEEMLGNIIDNACKWTRSNVVVKGWSFSDNIIIQVEDDGPGMSDQQL